MPRTRILGSGSYAPERILKNSDLEAMVDTSDAWIRQRTGIVERRIASDKEATSDLSAVAARRALDQCGLDAADLDAIIVGTVTPDMQTPSCAAFVQAKIGAKNAFAFDISAACAGSLYGLSIADQFIRTGSAKRILVIGAELLSRVVDWQDRSTCILFGDAAGALVVGPSDDESGLLSTHLFSAGETADILAIKGGGSLHPLSERVLAEKTHKIAMNGREVYKFAVRVLPEALNKAFEANNIRPSDIDHVVSHQANLRIVESVLDRVGIPLERCWINLDRYGNTSSASLPLSLDEANRSGRLKKGDLIAMMAIGAGMAWGSGLMRW